MNKNIGYVNLPPDLVRWLMKQLALAPGDAAADLTSALYALLTGGSDSLMLEVGETETQVPVAEAEIRAGSLVILPRARRVTRDGEEIYLTPKEFDLLCFLARNRGEVFTKEQIYRAVWEDEYLMDDSNVMAFIRKLRKKIEPNPDAPEYILTIWGIGYKFRDTD